MEISLKAETLFHWGTLPITNSLIASWVTVLLLIVVAFALRLSLQNPFTISKRF